MAKSIHFHPGHVYGEKGIIHLADYPIKTNHICGEDWWNDRYVPYMYIDTLYDKQREQLCQDCVDVLPVYLLSQ